MVHWMYSGMMRLTLEDVGAYDKILLSPGPGIPVEAGICLDLIRQYAATKSILGSLPWPPGHWRGIWRQANQPEQGISWCVNPDHYYTAR